MIRTRIPSKDQHHATLQRPGFTLLELLIAIVLTAALLSAMWGILSLYNSLLTAGRRQTAEEQLVRSLFQILEEDLAAVALEPSASSLLLSPELKLSFPLSVTPEPDISSDFAFASDLLGAETRLPAEVSLTGSATAVRMTYLQQADRPQPMLSDIDQLNVLGGGSAATGSDTAAGQPVDVPEFRTVVYQFESYNGSAGPTALRPGLYRLQTDAAPLAALLSDRSTAEQFMVTDDVAIDASTLAILMIPPEGDVEESSPAIGPSKTATQIDHIPEAVGCRFEYFDGDQWMDTWTAEQSAGLPAAIRVSIDIVAPEELEQVVALLTGPTGESPLSGILQRSFTEVSEQVPSGGPATIPNEIRIVPRTYHRIILLDTSRPVSAVESSGSIEGELFE